MDVHQLKLFLAGMQSSSMTRAAEKIHLSPGAVSLQLHNLAAELHTELFVRSGKRLIPTPAASRLADHAKHVVRLMGQIEVTVSVTEETLAGLHDRRFDLGLITLPVPEENLRIIPLFDEELLVVRPSATEVRGSHIGVLQASALSGVPF